MTTTTAPTAPSPATTARPGPPRTLRTFRVTGVDVPGEDRRPTTQLVVGSSYTVDKPGYLDIRRGNETVASWAAGQWQSITVVTGDLVSVLERVLTAWAEPVAEVDWPGAPALADRARMLAEILAEEL